jgi:uncharacterized protein (TIGR03663 family)
MLDARPMDHDESIHAYLSYKLLNEHSYSYNPAFHGPLLYFSTAGIFALLGDSELTARLVPVVFSMIGVIVAYGFRRWIGSGAYVLVFLMLFSTSILYYSRYLRNDLILVSSFFVILYCYFRYLEGDKRFVYLASIFLAIMLTSKENGYIYALILLSFIVMNGIHEKKLYLLFKWNLKKLRFVLISSLFFLSIFVSFYTAGFSDWEGIERATFGAFSHWFAMHERSDHWKPIYYYLQILLQYEFLPLALAITSIPIFYRRLKRREISKLELFALYWLLITFVAYHFLSHKVPWLTVHLVAPLALFGSLYLEETLFAWRNRGFRAAFVVVAIATLIVSLHITYINYNDAREGLVYIQVQPSAIELSKEIIQRLENGKNGMVYEPKNDYWPLPWYLRHHPIPFYSKFSNNADFVVTSKEMRDFFEYSGYRLEGEYEIRPGYFMVLMEKHMA